jgi:lipopolysaccharide export system protein LptC
MKTVRRIPVAMAIGLVLALGLARSATAQKEDAGKLTVQSLPIAEDSQIRGFRVPNFDEQGVMTSQMFGEFARVLPDGNVEITQLRMEFYSYNGEERITDMTVTAPQCYFNRNNGVAISDSDVRISRNEFVVTGRGFVFDNENQQLRILNDSKVVVHGASKRFVNVKGKDQ